MVVVYRVDRLTRSRADFAWIVDVTPPDADATGTDINAIGLLLSVIATRNGGWFGR